MNSKPTSEARQLWIKIFDDGGDVAVYETKPKFKYDYHVIEYKALTDLQRENDELKDTLRHFEHECETIQEMKTEMYKLQQQIADYEKALNLYENQHVYIGDDFKEYFAAREVLAKYKGAK